jgi:tRNA (Thr-GGU) A37 N-methylase
LAARRSKPQIESASVAQPIRSEIKNRTDAPRSSREGAPNAFLEIEPAYAGGMDRMRVGDEVIVITWLSSSMLTSACWMAERPAKGT